MRELKMTRKKKNALVAFCLVLVVGPTSLQ